MGAAVIHYRPPPRVAVEGCPAVDREGGEGGDPMIVTLCIIGIASIVAALVNEWLRR
jgi:hypothetical protein